MKPAIASRFRSSYKFTCICVVIDAEVELVLYSSSSTECAETRHAGQERNNARIWEERDGEGEILWDWLERRGHQEEYRWILRWIIIKWGEEGHHNSDNNAWLVPWCTRTKCPHIRHHNTGLACVCVYTKEGNVDADKRIKQANQPSPWQQHKPICLPAPLRTTTFTFMNICTKESYYSLTISRPACVCVCACVCTTHPS